LARKTFEIKVCACPGRDLKNDEKNQKAFKINDESTKLKSGADFSSVKNNSNTKIQNKNFSDLKSVKELEITSIRHIDNCDEQQIYTLEVRGKNNYQVLSKIRDALEFQHKFLQNSLESQTNRQLPRKQSTMSYDTLPNMNATTSFNSNSFDPNDSVEK
jgi:hypothetical protein